MLELGRNLGFVEKSLGLDGVGAEPREEKLEGDVAVEGQIRGTKDRTHPTLANLFEDLKTGGRGKGASRSNHHCNSEQCVVYKWWFDGSQ